MSNQQRFREKVKMGKKTTKRGSQTSMKATKKTHKDNASSPKEIESSEAEPEEEEGEELEESSLAAGGPSDDIASPAPEESKEADDGGVLLGNLLDTEDISSSEEEDLLEDTSNGMEDISEPGSTDGLVDNLEAVVRKQEEPWRQESKDSECPVHKKRKTKHKKETCHHRKHRRQRWTNSNNEDREEEDCYAYRSNSMAWWTRRTSYCGLWPFGRASCFLRPVDDQAAVTGPLQLWTVPCCDQACDVLGPSLRRRRCAYRKTCYVVSVSVLWWTVLRLRRRTTATSGSSTTAALT
ncbi:hypothetical protein MRX96_024572 [Rhipicephalus microplus]